MTIEAKILRRNRRREARNVLSIAADKSGIRHVVFNKALITGKQMIDRCRSTKLCNYGRRTNKTSFNCNGSSFYIIYENLTNI
jgi:hypothetical protein